MVGMVWITTWDEETHGKKVELKKRTKQECYALSFLDGSIKLIMKI